MRNRRRQCRHEAPKGRTPTEPIARDAWRRCAIGPRLRFDALEERALLAAAVTISGADALSFMANTPGTVDVSYSGGVYTITDLAEVINVTNDGTGTVTGNGTNTITATNTTSLDFDLHGGNSSLILISNAHPTTLHDSTGGGDFFQIGFGTSRSINGAVTIGPTVGSSTAAIDDQNDSTGRNVGVTSTALTGITPASIDLTGATLSSLGLFAGTGADTFTVNGTRTQTTIQGNSAGDTVKVQATGAGAPLKVMGSGAETVSVGDAGSVQGILSAVTVSNSNAGTAVSIDNSADPVTRTATIGTGSITGLAPAAINFAGPGGLTVRGGSGGDTFAIDNNGTNTFPTKIVGGAGDDLFRFLNVSSLGTGGTLDGGGGGNTLDYTGFTGAVAVNLMGGTATGTAGVANIQRVIPDHAPVAVDDSYSTNQDTPLTIAGLGVLGNDTDADGDPLSPLLVSLPSHGSLALNPDGSFTYTPDAGYTGLDSFTYKADDGTATSDTVRVSLAIFRLSPWMSVGANVDPSAFGQPVTLTATVAAILPFLPVPTGSVDFMEGADLLATAPLDANGQASFSTSSLAAGGHAITVVYGGDVHYRPSTSPVFVQGVNRDASSASLTSSSGASVSGQHVTFTATIAATPPGAGTPTGAVQLLDGPTVLGTALLDASGGATFVVSSLSVGSHTMTLSYLGDGGFEPSSTAIAHDVARANSATSLASAVNPSAFGQTVTISATVAAVGPGAGVPTGTVDFFDGGAPIGSAPIGTSGVATLAVSGLPVGSHAITARYSGDGRFNGGTSAPMGQDVTRASTAVSIATTAGSTAFGQAVTFTAIVNAVAPGAGTPTGTVTFRDGPTVLGTAGLSGQSAGLTTAALGVGAHSITATYDGDGQFTASPAATVSQAVARAATTTQLFVAPTAVVNGQPATFVAVVAPTSPGAGAPTGIVAFYDGLTPVGGAFVVNGQATASIALSGAGRPHAITAMYLGDGNFQGSGSPSAGMAVLKADTRASVAVAANRSGGKVNVLAQVTAVAPGGGVPTGPVVFRLNGRTSWMANLVNGQAIVSLNARAAMNRRLTVQYLGDADDNGSLSPPVVITRGLFAASSRPSSAIARPSRRGR